MSKRKENTFRTILKGPTLGYIDSFNYREIWQEISKELNAEFKILHNSGRELEIHNISIPYKKWNIKISISDSKPLKFQISFPSRRNFKFLLTKKGFFERFLVMFRKRRKEFGSEEFIKYFIIYSDNFDLVEQILTDEVRRSLLKYKLYSIYYKTDAKTETAELISAVHRRLRDKETILELIDMFKLFIDNLEELEIIK